MELSFDKAVVKIVILGDSGVGKSCLLTQYIENRFSNQYKATIGSDFLTKDVTLSNGQLVTLQLWDTAGQERFQSLGTAFFRGADCCVLVYDVNVEASFTNLKRWRREFLIQAGISSELQSAFPFIVLGNKIDIKAPRVIAREDVLSWCEQNAVAYFETSAKFDTNVDKAFEAVAHHAMQFHGLDARGVIEGAIDTETKISLDKYSGNREHEDGGCC